MTSVESAYRIETLTCIILVKTNVIYVPYIGLLYIGCNVLRNLCVLYRLLCIIIF